MIIPQICDKSFYAYQMTNKNRTIQRKLPHKNTKKLKVLRVTKLTTKSSHSTPKDSYKTPGKYIEI